MGAATDIHHIRIDEVFYKFSQNNRSSVKGNTQYIDKFRKYSGEPQKISIESWILKQIDEFKGDTPRIMYYMVVEYELENGDQY